MNTKKVLDKGYIELIDTLPQISEDKTSLDLHVVNAARISFGKKSRGGVDADWKLLKYLLNNGHTSPFEQVSITFEVSAPVVVWWQWTRHRTWKYCHANFISGRYTEFQEDNIYVPKEWRYQSKDNKQASSGVLPLDLSEKATDIYKNIWYKAYEAYEELLNMGIAREMARFVLPSWGLYYTCLLNVDLHNLLHFLDLRNHEHAQYEIREYANALSEILKDIAPKTWELKYGSKSS